MTTLDEARSVTFDGRIDIGAGLSDGLDELRPWPRRSAIVLSDRPAPGVLRTLRTMGFGSSIASLEDADRVAGLTAPFAFMIVDSSVFDENSYGIASGRVGPDAAVALIRRLHEYAPSSRMLLTAGRDGRTADVMVRALRAGISDVLDPDDDAELERALVGGLSAMGVHRERVLAVGAHPDDVEIGCAGTLLDHRRRGDRITILTLSRGAVGGDRERRLDEAVNVAESIGAQLIFGDLPDTLVSDGIDTIKLIEEVVRAVDPTVVYTHSGHDNHQDHRAVSVATASATRQVRRLYAYQSPSATNEYRPTRFVPIDHVLQRKVQVLMMFDSQNGRTYLEPELVVAGSRYWARHLAANARYAEPFEVIRSVGDLRQSAGPRAVASALPEFGLPAYEPNHVFRPRSVSLA